MEVLKLIRKNQKLTIGDLAKRSGVPYRTIQNWELNGIRAAKLGAVEKVALALGVKVDELL